MCATLQPPTARIVRPDRRSRAPATAVNFSTSQDQAFRERAWGSLRSYCHLPGESQRPANYALCLRRAPGVPKQGVIESL